MPALIHRQRGSTLIMVILCLSVLLVSAIVILRSSNVAGAIAGNISFRAAGNQAAEVAVNDAITVMQGAIDPNAGTGFPANTYFSTMQATDPATGLPQIDWSAVPIKQSGNFQLQWVVDRLCQVSPVTDPSAQCQTSLGAQNGNSVTAGAVQFPTPPRVFYRITVLATGPRSTRSFVQALVEL
jgi:Tfp pilus assembly protein PilX